MICFIQQHHYILVIKFFSKMFSITQIKFCIMEKTQTVVSAFLCVAMLMEGGWSTRIQGR